MDTWVGKCLVAIGVICILVGLILWFAPKVPWLGRLPGDIHIHGERVSFHFPWVTCLVISVLLTILLNLILRR